MSKTIMAVGAHTGDAQLTCGMLLAKHAMAGDKVVIVDLTAGERGTPAGYTVESFRAYNTECAERFARHLGGTSIVLNTPDGELYDTKEQELNLATLMRQYHVDAVLYHWKNSLHKDHEAANRITENAIFYASLPTFEHELPPAPIRRFMCAENWEDEAEFVPYYWFDVTDAFPLWKTAIRELWLSEHSTSFKYLRYYEALSIVRGTRIGVDHATCFGTSPTAKRQILESL
ncbi:MAG: PIG-L family deacetylase [Clostridia bacterium]|nr:PIG-L family deacetylase [Clostridia bacterium]